MVGYPNVCSSTILFAFVVTGQGPSDEKPSSVCTVLAEKVPVLFFPVTAYPKLATLVRNIIHCMHRNTYNMTEINKELTPCAHFRNQDMVTILFNILSERPITTAPKPIQTIF